MARRTLENSIRDVLVEARSDKIIDNPALSKVEKINVADMTADERAELKAKLERVSNEV